jgi:hypothetical protein
LSLDAAAIFSELAKSAVVKFLGRSSPFKFVLMSALEFALPANQLR